MKSPWVAIKVTLAHAISREGRRTVARIGWQELVSYDGRQFTWHLEQPEHEIHDPDAQELMQTLEQMWRENQ